MSIFATATLAPRPKTKNIRSVSLAFAAVVGGLAVAQLFTFEKFSDVLANMWLPGGPDLTPIYAALIVTLEVWALPFLLSMRLSPAMRVVSMAAGWVVVAFWLGLTVWQNLASGVIANNGLLGATVTLPVGWWSVLFCTALGILAAWTAWGMWPLGRKAKK